MELSGDALKAAVEITRAAVSNDRSGVEALNHPEEVAKLFEIVAVKWQELYMQK